MTNEALLTVDQVAQRLNISKSWVYRAVISGHINAVNLGLGEKRGGYRVKESALQEFIERHSGGKKAGMY